MISKEGKLLHGHPLISSRVQGRKGKETWESVEIAPQICTYHQFHENKGGLPPRLLIPPTHIYIYTFIELYIYIYTYIYVGHPLHHFHSFGIWIQGLGRKGAIRWRYFLVPKMRSVLEPLWNPQNHRVGGGCKTHFFIENLP